MKIRTLCLVLDLSVTETHCGECQYLGTDSGVGGSGYPLCIIFRTTLDFDSGVGARRHRDCTANTEEMAL